MIYLIPEEMVIPFSLEVVRMPDNAVHVRDVIMSGEGVIAFKDSQYEDLKGLVKFLLIDAKFVTNFPGQRTAKAYLTEVETDLFISYETTHLKGNHDIIVPASKDEDDDVI